jgi:hypothetical protein
VILANARVAAGMAVTALFLLASCGASMPPGDPGAPDQDGGGIRADGGRRDAGTPDGGHADGGHGDGGGIDGGAPDAGPPVIPAPGGLVVDDQGGPRLTSGWLVTIIYPGADDDGGTLAALGAFLPGSRWLAAVGAEYGVSLQGHSSYVLDTPAPAMFTNSDVVDLVLGGIARGLWPAQPGGEQNRTIWLVVYPSGSVGLSEAGFYEGVHFAVFNADGGTPGGRPLIASWVIVSMDDRSEAGRILAHEVIEACSDPEIGLRPALSTMLPNPLATYGMEVADLCGGSAPVEEGGFSLPRSWSNAASQNGQNPCMPAPDGEPFVTLRGPPRTILASPGDVLAVPLESIAVNTTERWSIDLFPPTSTDYAAALDETTTAGGEARSLEVRLSPHLSPGNVIQLSIESQLDGGASFDWPLRIEVR